MALTYADEPGLTERKVAERGNLERARILEGRQTTASADLRAIGKEYVDSLRTHGRNETYARHIEQVVAALAKRRITDLKAPNFRAQVQHWLGTLKANWWVDGNVPFRRKKTLEVSGSTKNRILRELASLMNHAINTNVIVVNPLRGIKPFVSAKKTRQIPTVEEVTLLTSDRFRDDPAWLPFCLLAYTGCRVEEAMHLEWRDIDFKTGRIHVRVKPGVYHLKLNKERHLPLQRELWDILRTRFRTTGFIIEDERQRSNGSDYHLRESRRPLARRKPDSREYAGPFRRYMMRCGVPESRADQLSPHSMRHWYICAMLATGAAWDDVMEWVGHSQTSTTLGYRALKSLVAHAVSAWPKGDFHLRREPPPRETSVPAFLEPILS